MTSNRTKRAIVLTLIAVALVSGAYGVRAVLSSVSIKHLDHSGPQAASPVRVELAGVSREGAYQSAVTRVSPRGNDTVLHHSFPGEGNSWAEQKEYVRTFRLYLSEQADAELRNIHIDIGSSRTTTGHPNNSNRWEEVSGERTKLPDAAHIYIDKNAKLYEYVPAEGQYAFSVAPPFRTIVNYVGDVTLGLWALLWALLSVLPFVVIRSVMRTNAALGERIGSLFLAVVGALVAAATALRFVNPLPAVEGRFEPLALAAAALSVSLVAMVAWYRPNTDPGLTATTVADAPSHTAVRGRRFGAVLAAITLVGFVLRVLDMDAFMSDMFNLPAALSLHDHGEFYYPRNKDLTRAIAWLMDAFGRSVAVSKIPAVVTGTATIPLMYTLGSFVSRKLGLAAAAVFALSPFHIAFADYVREYPFNLLVATITILVLFFVFRRFADRRRWFLPIFAAVSLLLFALIELYSETFNNPTIPALIQGSAFAAVPLFLHYVRRHFPKAITPVTIAVALLLVVGTAFIHELRLFSEQLRLRPDFFRSYVNPFATDSVQSFSFAAVSPLFIFGLLVLPYINQKRNPYIDAALMGFWGTLLLFSLKLAFGNSDRYLYHVSMFHTLLLAGGLLWLFDQAMSLFGRNRKTLVGTALLFVVLVNPVNTMQSALNLIPDTPDPRTVTKLSGRDYMKPVAEFMRENGVDESTPVIDAARDPYFLSVMLDRRISWTRSTAFGRSFAVGENMYPVTLKPLKEAMQEYDSDEERTSVYGEGWRQRVDRSCAALQKHDSGFFVTDKYRLFPPRDFNWREVEFQHVGNVSYQRNDYEGFALYRWRVLGSDLPDFSTLFVNSGYTLFQGR